MSPARINDKHINIFYICIDKNTSCTIRSILSLHKRKSHSSQKFITLSTFYGPCSVFRVVPVQVASSWFLPLSATLIFSVRPRGFGIYRTESVSLCPWFGDVEEMYNGSYTSMRCSQAFPSGRRCPTQDAQDLLVSLELGFVRGCQSDRSFHDIVGDFTQGLQL